MLWNNGISLVYNNYLFYYIMSVPCVCFIHICCTDKGLSVIIDQINKLKQFDLYDKLSKIYLGCLEDYNSRKITNKYNNISIAESYNIKLNIEKNIGNILLNNHSLDVQLNNLYESIRLLACT